MKRIECEHDNGDRRCRRTAQVAISYLFRFGTRLSMTGPAIPVYLQRVTLRCSDHLTVEHEQGRIPIADYFTKIDAAGEA